MICAKIFSNCFLYVLTTNIWNSFYYYSCTILSNLPSHTIIQLWSWGLSSTIWILESILLTIKSDSAYENMCQILRTVSSIQQNSIKVFLGSSTVKESAYSAGDLGSIPRLGRSPGEWNSYQLKYSGLENSMNCIDHGVIKSWT